MSTLQPFQQRVVAERTELASKLKSLQAFIEDPTTLQRLTKDELRLLTEQRDHMTDYLDVLEIRIRRFNGAKPYVCHKRVFARPMTRQAYNDLRDWKLPDNEDGADEGFLVEYTDGGAANHPDFSGYISWSPTKVFEAGYKEAPNP
jgi:hypothetical protein